MSLKFQSTQRIRKADVFSAVKKKGKFIRGVYINVWVFEKASPDTAPKIGLIVGRKTSRLAHQRNLWKRRIREVFRRNQKLIKTNQWILVQAKGQEKVALYSEINTEFLRAIKATSALIV